MMHNLTLGSLLRHTCSSPVRGSGLHMLKLLKSDIQLVPSPLTPTTTFPDFAGGDCLDLESTPQVCCLAKRPWGLRTASHGGRGCIGRAHNHRRKSPPPPTTVTTVGKNEMYHREKLVRRLLVHKLLDPRPPPPHPALF